MHIRVYKSIKRSTKEKANRLPNEIFSEIKRAKRKQRKKKENRKNHSSTILNKNET